MKDFWKKHKLILAISGFILIVPPLFGWSFMFMLHRIQAKNDLIQEKIIDNSLEKAKIDKIPEMEKINADFENNKQAAGTILAFSDKVDFIEYVEILAQETKNKIDLKVLEENSVDADANKKAKPVAKKSSVNEKKSIEEGLSYKQYITMQVSLEGDYAGFLNFVHKLENNKYYVNILSFDLQKGFVEKEFPASEGDLVSAPGGMFASPANNNSNNLPNNGIPTLKSSFNIIVYTE